MIGRRGKIKRFEVGEYVTRIKESLSPMRIGEVFEVLKVARRAMHIRRLSDGDIFKGRYDYFRRAKDDEITDFKGIIRRLNEK